MKRIDSRLIHSVLGTSGRWGIALIVAIGASVGHTALPRMGDGAGFAYKVGDGTATGGRLVVDRPGKTGAFSVPIKGAPVRWVEAWKGFAVRERDILYRIDLDGKRSPVYDLAPLLKGTVDAAKRKPSQKTAVSEAYDVDIAPQGDRLVLLTRADWGVREVDLKSKRVRLVTTGDRIAKAVGQKLRLSTESQTGVRWSSDGRQLAVALPGLEAWGEDGDESDAALFVLSANGSGVKRVGGGVPVDWMSGRDLLAIFTPEGGDRRELRVYGAGGGLKSRLSVAAPVEASWNGQSVLFLKKRPGGATAFVVVKATPNLKVVGSAEVSDRPVTLTGIPSDSPASYAEEGTNSLRR